MKITYVLMALLVAVSSAAMAGNLPSGTLTVGQGGGNVYAWLNPTGYDFATNRHSLDLTYAGVPVTMSGTVDLSDAPMPGTGEWSHYYFNFVLRDVNGKLLDVVMNTDWLGGWHGIPAQPWDRLRIQTGPTVVGGPQQHFSTLGGQRDDGVGWVYPSFRIYDIEMIINPIVETVSLRVYGKGRETVDTKQWYEVGTMDVSSLGFDFANTEIYARLWTDAPAGSVSFSNMNIEPIPEPSAFMALAGGLVALAGSRRRRS